VTTKKESVLYWKSYRGNALTLRENHRLRAFENRVLRRIFGPKRDEVTGEWMMEAARTSEMSVDVQLRTRQYIPEDSELHTRRCENLKSHRMEEVAQ
jgi:hypothetical protein